MQDQQPTDFESLLEYLNSEPTEQCVIRKQWFEDKGFTAEAIGKAANRPVRTVTEYSESKMYGNMAFRDSVYVYAPKEGS